MAGAGADAEVPHLPGARVLVVEARFYAHINDLLLAGAQAVLATAGAAGQPTSWSPVPWRSRPPSRSRTPSGRFRRLRGLGLRDPRRDHPLRAGRRRELPRPHGARDPRAAGRSATASSPSRTRRRPWSAPIRAAQDKGGGAARAALSLLAWRRGLRQASQDEPAHGPTRSSTSGVRPGSRRCRRSTRSS